LVSRSSKVRSDELLAEKFREKSADSEKVRMLGSLLPAEKMIFSEDIRKGILMTVFFNTTPYLIRNIYAKATLTQQKNNSCFR